MKIQIFEDEDCYFLVAADERGHALQLIENKFGEKTRKSVYHVRDWEPKQHFDVILMSKVES